METQRLVARTESELSKTNFKHKVVIPEKVLERFGRARIALGYDLVIVGHFHCARTFQLGSGELRIIDAWFRSKQLEVLRGAGLEPELLEISP